MTKDNIVQIITNEAMTYIDREEAIRFRNRIVLILKDYEIVKSSNELVEYSQSEDDRMIQMFFVSKKVEGLSDRTLKAYAATIQKFRSVMPKQLADINTTDIRFYFAMRATQDKVSKCTQDNERRNLSSVFSFLNQEGYIKRNPVAGIKKIKQDHVVKDPFSATEMELIRRSCKDKRESALIEFLFSTGCRVGEIPALQIEAIDFSEKKVIVSGKGNKERYVFLTEKCILAINDYLEERGNPKYGALFLSAWNKTGISRDYIEQLIREIGKRSGVPKCHPHRFRRTTATIALRRGMPLEVVQEMLGHSDIRTTQIYAQQDKADLKRLHEKYIY